MEILKRIPDSFWVKVSDVNKVGTSDIIGDINGIACYIEVKKSEKEKPSDVQQYRIRKATLRGAVSFVTHNWTDCLDKLIDGFRAKGVRLHLVCAPRKRPISTDAD